MPECRVPKETPRDAALTQLLAATLRHLRQCAGGSRLCDRTVALATQHLAGCLRRRPAGLPRVASHSLLLPDRRKVPGSGWLAAQLAQLGRRGPGLHSGGDPDGHWPLADRAHLASSGCHLPSSRVDQPERRNTPLLLKDAWILTVLETCRWVTSLQRGDPLSYLAPTLRNQRH